MFCGRSNKKKFILDGLSLCDGRKNKTLVVHTCYLDKDLASLKDLIKTIRNQTSHLNDIQIYVDLATARKCRGELKKWIESRRKISVSVYAVKCPGLLFHSKAYALIAFNNKDEVVSGGLVVGSGNLSKQGVGIQNGNIESFLVSSDIETIQEFWNRTSKLDVDDIEKVKDSQTVEEFIINEGIFVHLWSDKDAVQQFLSCKYTLTDDYRKKINESQNELKNRKFDIDAKTISKRYLAFDESGISTKDWKTNYLIETFLGYWTPKIVLDKITTEEDDNAFVTFKSKIISSLKNQLESNRDVIQNEYQELLDLGIILELPEKQKPYDSLFSKITDLENNDVKLKRIFYQYTDFIFPYDPDSESYYDNLNYFVHDLMDSIKGRMKKNKTMKAVQDLINNNNRNAFEEIEIE